jgi:hypothetical protein
MEIQVLTQALQSLASTQQSLRLLASLQTILLACLVVGALVGGIWIGVELRAIRQMLLHVQTSAEHIAEMTRDVLRRVS